MRLVAHALSISALIGCAGAPPPRPSDPGLFDQPDACPIFEDLCYDGYDFADTDGCPDPPPLWLAFEAGSDAVSAETERWLGEVVRNVEHLARGVRLELVDHSLPGEPDGLAGSRAEAVRRWLVGRGVDEALLVVAPSAPEDLERSGPSRQAGVSVRAIDCGR